ncbi:efflux RND transporter permease subunit [Steroidobacter sp.]|uniref:efflux RND transporter permease subunit n=1 Tax=Steroidobacter sp. TaxID=1978227 RepID=UPI0032C21777
MNLATWSLRNPIPVLLAFSLLVIAGIRGFTQLPIKNLPEIDLPTVDVVLTQPGAAPAQLETEVARRVEDAISNTVGLKHLRTNISDGVVHVSAKFEIGKPLSEALTEVKESVDRIRSDLPADVEQPAISADVVGGSPILTYAASSKTLDEEALSWLIDDVVNKSLRALPGVGRVERIGGVQREIRVEVDPVKLAALDATVADVSRGLRQVQLEASGGIAKLGVADVSMRTLGAVRQADELATTAVPLMNGRHLYLGDIASITDGFRDREQVSLLDGAPVVGFHIYRAKGKDETVIAEQVERALADLRIAHPDFRATLVSGSVEYTTEQFRGSMQMLFEGALLAILVVWWFLGDWRATLVAAVALPLSILPTFALMPSLGFSLNTLTLLALAVVAGILVDDAIVEIENIERHRRQGKTLLEATSDAVTEIALAVAATTLTLVVVFLPTALMPGIAGMLFRQFGWTAVIAVLASLLVARLLTPLLAVHWLKNHSAKSDDHGPLMRRYLAAVNWCLAHRGTTMATAVLFLIGSFALVPYIPTGFIPASDRGFVKVSLELPPGASLDDSLSAVEAVRSVLADVPGIAHVFSVAGEPAGDQQAPEARRALLTLMLAPRDARPTQKEIEKAVQERLFAVPGARFTVSGSDNAGELSLILTSEDARVLEATAQTMELQMRAVPGLSNVISTASLDRPELIVRPDARRAAEVGVDTATIAETVRIALGGDFDARLARLDLDNRQLMIRVRIPDSYRRDLDAIGQLRVRAGVGTVPLESIASLSIESGPQQLERYDRQRYVRISAGLGETALGDANAAVAGLPVTQTLPSNVRLIEDGDSELASELAGGFVTAIGAGVLCMFCVLVLLFKDVFQPVTILSVVPISLGGAFIALALTGISLDVPAMIGLVMLMGVVTKNSILLVDYAVTSMRERALERGPALIAACGMRARPIVMTTFAMIAGMLPIAFGFGADASFRQPMAVAVIGGLIVSTFLSLFLVPVIFTYVDDAEHWLRHAPARYVR